jgi:hypothetical protein
VGNSMPVQPDVVVYGDTISDELRAWARRA